MYTRKSCSRAPSAPYLGLKLEGEAGGLGQYRKLYTPSYLRPLLLQENSLFKGYRVLCVLDHCYLLRVREHHFSQGSVLSAG